MRENARCLIEFHSQKIISSNASLIFHSGLLHWTTTTQKCTQQKSIELSDKTNQFQFRRTGIEIYTHTNYMAAPNTTIGLIGWVDSNGNWP